MSNYYQNDRVFNVNGYEIYFTRFADSIVLGHFPLIITELKDILNNFYIPKSQIISPGGGLSTITQNLASLLRNHNWIKENIQSEHHVHGNIVSSESHEVDHYRSDIKGNVGLEIEWNNKDPFFDRDLENFRKLHQIGELSIGIIITRGTSLQEELLEVYKEFVENIQPYTYDNIVSTLSPISDAMKSSIKHELSLPRPDSVNRISKSLYSSKFGTATTHMDKLKLRLDRGVGNPCPLILIGIGKERLTL